ncbi:hypothetical protein [Deinococcus radiophilus]|uniref:hypothetical protein n=1 Tax=Deinococcus radiophilus TaxID=32062 RepID=UPI003606223B
MSRLPPHAPDQRPSLGALLLAAVFVLIGVQHFIRPEFFDRIVPPGLQELPMIGMTPRQATLISGSAEVAGASACCTRAPVRRHAGGCWPCWWPCFRPTSIWR